jgi:hypothetical protein
VARSRLPHDDVDAGWYFEELGLASFGAQRKHAVSNPEAVELDLHAVR